MLANVTYATSGPTPVSMLFDQNAGRRDQPMIRETLFRAFCVALTVMLSAHPPLARAYNAPDTLAGRYSEHFRNGDVQGNVYWSDDVVEIVPLSRDAVYIRVGLKFFNAHYCSISGVGTSIGDTIVYNDRSAVGIQDPPCILTISHRKNDLLIDDAQGSCKSYCGVRGSLSDKTLPWKSR